MNFSLRNMHTWSDTRWTAILGALFCIALLYVYVSDSALSRAIQHCESTPVAERFSCFRVAIEKHHSGNDLSAYTAFVQERVYTKNDTGGGAYAIFGTNCHTLQHALGDFVATKSEDIPPEEALRYGDGRCAGGFYMGFLKRYAYMHEYSNQSLSALYDACPHTAREECAHELGHALYDRHGQPVLGVIDTITKEKYNAAVDSPTVSSATPNIRGAFSDCTTLLEKDLQPYCYTGIGHNMFLFGEIDEDGYIEQFEACENMETQSERTQCQEFLMYRVGINYASPHFISGSYQDGIMTCENAVAQTNANDRDALFAQCYIGVGGGIGLFVDSEFLASDETPEDIVALRDTLYAYADRCSAAPEQFVPDCFSGLLGTHFYDAYTKFRVYHPMLERIVPYNDSFEVVS